MDLSAPYLQTVGAALAGLLGALVGSFANVVIHRLPRGESVVFPGSHCPSCSTPLGPLELVPVLSWAALRGRCRSCRQPIAVRYPLVELLTAGGFVALWLRWPPTEVGAAVLPLLAVFAMLVMLALIDIDTFTLPDSLTLPALVVALATPLLHDGIGELPDLGAAAMGAALGAGVLTMVNRLGGLVLRRLRDTRERLWPIGFDSVNIAALLGAAGGLTVGLLAGAVSVAVNLACRRSLRLPEPLVMGAWLAVLLLAAAGVSIVGPLSALVGSIAAAGTVALAGAAYWWLHDLVAGPPPAEEEAEAEAEPVAMGFGDVKLAAVLGAVLGPEKLLVMFFLSFLLGAAGGLLGRVLGGERVVPFGPYLVVAGLVALFLGDPLLGWYLGMLRV